VKGHCRVSDSGYSFPDHLLTQIKHLQYNARYPYYNIKGERETYCIAPRHPSISGAKRLLSTQCLYSFLSILGKDMIFFVLKQSFLVNK
jgi:hypothetical protein